MEDLQSPRGRGLVQPPAPQPPVAEEDPVQRVLAQPWHPRAHLFGGQRRTDQRIRPPAQTRLFGCRHAARHTFGNVGLRDPHQPVNFFTPCGRQVCHGLFHRCREARICLEPQRPLKGQPAPMHYFSRRGPLPISYKPQSLQHRNHIWCRKCRPGSLTGKDVRSYRRPVVRNCPLGHARQACDDTVGMLLACSRKILNPANLMRQPQHRHRNIFPVRQHLRQSRLRLRACPPTHIFCLSQRHQRHAGNLIAGREHVVPTSSRRVIAGVQRPGFPQKSHHRLRHLRRHFRHVLHRNTLSIPMPHSKPP